MHKSYHLLWIQLVAIIMLSCNQAPEQLTMNFSSADEVSTYSWALEELPFDLPDDWSSYNYMVLEMKASSPQRFLIGPLTPEGHIAKSIQPFPGAWLRFCVPLDFYKELPPSAIDLAATYNKARDLGQINVHNPGLNPLNKVQGLSIFMKNPVNDPTLEIRSISLTMENPGDTLLQEGYLVDCFGQWATQDWPGKIKNMDDLKADWQQEDTELTPLDEDNYSKYGGYKTKRVKNTGFFRTEKIDNRWWLIDPEGYLFLSVGSNCINASSRTRIQGREYIFEYLKEGSLQADFYGWNIENRYGKDAVDTAWVDKAVKRMNAWGMNTVANWSSSDMINSDRIPFTLSLQGLKLHEGMMGLPDIYDSNYAKDIDTAIGEMAQQYKNNPWLLGYFVGNEQPWPGQEDVLCDRLLAGEDRPMKRELEKFLAENGNTAAGKKKFVYQTFGMFLELVNKTLKKHDPNHLNLGMRFSGDTEDDLLTISGKHFDVFSFNCYKMQPIPEFMKRIEKCTGLPMMIGEYHFGVPDRGMSAGIVQVNSHQERANAYRFYNEQGFSHPSMVGTHWFQWIDQPNTGRGDGENYGIGIVDITDRPYPELTEAMKETHRRLYQIHTGQDKPYDKEPQWVAY